LQVANVTPCMKRICIISCTIYKISITCKQPTSHYV
jgi:hypothetical protein